jgi:hypothetical protein
MDRVTPAVPNQKLPALAFQGFTVHLCPESLIRMRKPLLFLRMPSLKACCHVAH